MNHFDAVDYAVEAVGRSHHVDPMAAQAPSAVQEAVSSPDQAHKTAEISVGTTYARHESQSGGVMGGMGQDGLVLNHRHYIDEDPAKDYRFCSVKPRLKNINKRYGWEPIRTADNHNVKIDNLVLCDRPKEVGEQNALQKAEIIRRHRKRHHADNVASRHGFTGPVEEVHME